MAVTSIDCKAPGMQSIARAAGGGARSGRPASRRARGSAGAATINRAWPRSAIPNRLDWDAVAPDHPVIFTRTCGHIASVNGRALARPASTDATPDPAGGRYDREGGTQPRRRLRDRADAAAGGGDAVAPTSSARRCCAPTQAYIAAGGTSVHDAGGLVGPAFVPGQDLADGRDAAHPHLRVRHREQPPASADGAARHRRAHRARRRAAAAGRLQGDDRRLLERAHRGHARAVHVELPRLRHPLLDAGRPRRPARPRPPRGLPVHGARGRRSRDRADAGRHGARAARVAARRGCAIASSTAASARPTCSARVHAQRIVPAMQPAFFWEFGDGYIANYGQQRADTMFPARSLLAAGVPVAGSSDAPVTHYAPLFGIEQALTRRDHGRPGVRPRRAGRPRPPPSACTRSTARTPRSRRRARAASSRASSPTWCVLGDDIARVPVKDLRHLPVAMTVVGGEVVYEAA